MIVKHQNFNQLIDNVYQTHCQLQLNAKKAVNLNLTIRNWLVGCYIVEFEQNGEDRAQYGDKLIDAMSKSIKAKGLKGFSPMALRTCRTFYKTYPKIQQTLSVIFQNQGVKSLPYNSIEIQQTLSVELDDNFELSPGLLLSRLSYSHFIELIKFDDPLERLFYEVETIKNKLDNERIGHKNLYSDI